MKVLADITPRESKGRISRTWTREQESILAGLYHCWFIYNGSIYRISGVGTNKVIQYFECLFHELQLKYLKEDEIYFRSGKAIKKKYEMIKIKNKEGNRKLIYSLVNEFFQKYHGYNLFATSLLSTKQVDLSRDQIFSLLHNSPEVDFNYLNIPSYSGQERVNSWYAAENAILLRAVSKFFLKYGSFNPPRKGKEDTRKTWEQVNELFEDIRNKQKDFRFPDRKPNAICRHYKTLKAKSDKQLHLYYLYGLKLFDLSL